MEATGPGAQAETKTGVGVEVGRRRGRRWGRNKGMGRGRGTTAWTKNTKLGVDGSLLVANDVSMPRECFDKILEFLKRNWPRAARF